MRFQIYILLILPYLTFGIFETSKNVLPLNSGDEMNSVLTQSEYVSLFFFYYDKNCQQCADAELLMQTVANENKGIIQVYHINCQKVGKFTKSQYSNLYCDKKYLSQLPQITFYKPIQNKVKPYEDWKEVPFFGEASSESLAKFAQQLLPAYRMRIKTRNDYNQFISIEKKLNKVLLFTDKQRTGAVYKALTIHFFGLLHFGEILNDLQNEEIQSLIKEFGVREFPQIFILTKQQNGQCCEIEYFDGNLLLADLKEWLDIFARIEKVDYDQPELFVKETEESETFSNRLEFPSYPFTIQVYEEQILKEEKPILIHIYREQQEHLAWEKVKNKFKNLFEYYELLVGSKEDSQIAKNILGAKYFPSIKFLPIGFEKKKRNSQFFFASSQDLEDISKEIFSLIPDKSTNIQETDHTNVIKTGLQQGKILVFYFYKDAKVGLTFRIMTNMKIFENYSFYNTKDASEATLKKFKVNKLPEVVGIFRELKEGEDINDPVQSESIRLASYQRQMDFSTLKDFLSIFDTSIKNVGKELIEIHSNRQFNELCGKKESYCFIGLIDKKEAQKINKYEFYLETMDKIKNKFEKEQNAQFIFLDATCQDELLLNLDISELPNYISYIQKKKEQNFNNYFLKRFSKMIGRFEYDSIYRFVQNYLKGKTQLFKLQNPLIYETKTCYSNEENQNDEVYEQMNTQDESELQDQDQLTEKKIKRKIKRKNKQQENKEQENSGRKNEL